MKKNVILDTHKRISIELSIDAYDLLTEFSIRYGLTKRRVLEELILQQIRIDKFEGGYVNDAGRGYAYAQRVRREAIETARAVDHVPYHDENNKLWNNYREYLEAGGEVFALSDDIPRYCPEPEPTPETAFNPRYLRPADEPPEPIKDPIPVVSNSEHKLDLLNTQMPAFIDRMNAATSKTELNEVAQELRAEYNMTPEQKKILNDVRGNKNDIFLAAEFKASQE